MSAIEERRSPQVALKEYAFLAPRLVRLVWRLLRDPRVPPRSKAVLFVLAGYLASPVDLVPDFLVGLGQLDDLVIAAFALDRLINHVDPAIVRQHWDGDGDVLEIVKNVLDIGAGLLPRWFKRFLKAAS